MHSVREENTLIHCAKVHAYPERNFRLAQNVPLQIDPRCNFGHSEPVPLQFHDASFRDVNDALTLLFRPSTTECHVFDLVDKLPILTFFENSQPSVLDPRVETARREITAENDGSRTGRDIDETAGAGGDMRGQPVLRR